MRRSFPTCTWLLSCLALFTSGCSQESADVVYNNGRIYTVDEAQPFVEAVAITDGRFTVVGTNVDVEGLIGPDTEVIDLEGGFTMPGMVDAHIHPFLVYVQEEQGNLLFSDQIDPNGIAAAIREYAAANPDKEWIRGEKYGLGAFPGGRMTREWLDEVVADRPALIFDDSGHNATANTVALERAGITRDTPNPPLGVIDKDPETGEPTGYLSETAIGLVGRHLDRIESGAYKRSLERSHAQMTAWGITSFNDMMTNEEVNSAYFELLAEGNLPFRVNAALALNDYTDEFMTPDEAVAYMPTAAAMATENLNTANFKYWADGTALSYTALLVDPYANRDTYGAMTLTEDMRETAVELLGQGLSGHMHSSGDGTTRSVLDLVEEARERFPGQVRRFHIGHSHLVHPDDLSRFAELDVVAEVGPSTWYPSPVRTIAEDLIGPERSERFSDIRALLDAGVAVAWGSDWPAGTPDGNPFRGLEPMVTRAHPEGLFEGTWGTPITLEEGIRIVTMGGAYAMQREDDIGSIEVGKYADMVVLDRDLFEIPPETIYDVVVERTVFGGETVHLVN